jgi:NAD+ synthase
MLRIDPAAETDKICQTIRTQVSSVLGKRGVVVAMSGGIDSSVCAALCARALGPDRILGLILPDQNSSCESAQLAKLVAESLHVSTQTIDISPVLSAVGMYEQYDTVMRGQIPEYSTGWSSKLTIEPIAPDRPYSIFYLVVQDPQGASRKIRLKVEDYLSVVSLVNYKQRVRMMLCYHHADRLNRAVASTPNRLEHDLGFFVKLGDGGGDFKPIAHLYKSQVYQIAQFLGVPREVIDRRPTTDTYSLPQGQDEFYFRADLQTVDCCLYGMNHGFAPDEIAQSLGKDPHFIKAMFDDLDRKRKAASYLLSPPLAVEPGMARVAS